MKEGEPVLGGGQANLGGAQPSNVGANPIPSTTLQPSSNPLPPSPLSPITPSPTPSSSSPSSSSSLPPSSSPSPSPSPSQTLNTNPPTPASSTSQASPSFSTTSNFNNDIVLSDSSSNSSNTSKKSITIAIVVIIILALAGLGMYFFTRNNNTNSNDNTYNSEVKTSFNLYANYLLSESDSDAEISEESWNYEKLEEILSSDDKNRKEEYINKLINLYNTFKDTFYNNVKRPIAIDEEVEEPEDYEEDEEYTENKGTEDEEIEEEEKRTEEEQLEYTFNIVDNNTNILQMLKAYISINNITAEDMANLYLTEGGDNMVLQVENTYKSFTTSEDSPLYEYSVLKIDTAKLISIIYNEYNNAGCIVNQTLNQECITSTTFSNEYTNNQTLLRKHILDLERKDRHMISDPVSMSRMIYESLNPTTQEEQEVQDEE